MSWIIFFIVLAVIFAIGGVYLLTGDKPRQLARRGDPEGLRAIVDRLKDEDY